VRIERTVIGSFPRTPGKSLNSAIHDVLGLQLRQGVDVVVDGEQRADMITYFEQIPGLGRGGRGLKVTGKVRPMDDPGEFYKLVDYISTRFYLDSIGRRDVRVKVTITGPVTLGMTSAMGGLTGYKSLRDPTLFQDIADALLPLGEKALSMGALLQVDEPGLSARFESPKYTEHLLSRLSDSAIDAGRVSLHICGDVRKLFGELMALSVNVFSFGFSRRQESMNMEAISRESLGGKRLGAGFISNTYVEEPDVALRRLEAIAGKVGVENIAYLHPDCGFEPTPPELVEPILSNMRDASERFFQSQG